MIDTMNAPLVRSHGRRVAVGAEATSILWLGDDALLTLGDGSVRRMTDAGEVAAHPVHRGAILAACRHPDGCAIVTGGDDGRVCRVTPDGDSLELGRFERRWVEHLVASPASGLIVAGVGPEAVVWKRGATAPSHRYATGSTIGGLALDGKGKRLAVAHYNGATLFHASTAGSGRVALDWIGAHLACTMSADGRHVVTALQETGLHGWRLPDLRDMRMSGYAAKTRSFSWDRRGAWLATSGNACAILWPFDGEDGPMDKPALLLAERRGTIATRVAFHPRGDLLAVGYDDGVVVLTQTGDDRPLLVDDDGAAITALCWNDAGTRLGWGDRDGRIGILDMAARA
ncbi:WD40 repeat domain-containing protein [Sphingomonas sp. CFBP 13603]|uniref:WD40 repeat domain-containing protein n=1 Tax=Sphingomonas sp. CFBP 13603 TaxID=2774040 RepID=UPI001866CAF6|nr:WD40 repeat domain-containing protein [Sphingomonas sp. CFBP 13603]MBE2992910.1 WD40 repeat domain-containing protein [Sphingomonas sp. CFBP 13603]